MLVNRRMYTIKPGRMDEAAALLKSATEEYSSYANAYRIYMAETGDISRLAVEWEFESLEEYGRLWQGWMELPESAAFNEKWLELADPGSTNHLWWKV